MPISKFLFCLSASLLVCLCAVASARADEVVITSGSLTASGLANIGSDIPHSFTFRGEGFQAGGGGEPISMSPTSCSFCQPGDLMEARAHAGFGIRGLCSLTFQGTRFPFGSCRHSHFDFSTDPVRIPLSFPTSDSLIVTTNFTMTGDFTISDLSTDQTFVALPLSGQGTATIRLIRWLGDNTIRIDSVTFTFAPAATPEPATLLLLGTGLAGAAWGARRRRAARKND